VLGVVRTAANLLNRRMGLHGKFSGVSMDTVWDIADPARRGSLSVRAAQLDHEIDAHYDPPAECPTTCPTMCSSFWPGAWPRVIPAKPTGVDNPVEGVLTRLCAPGETQLSAAGGRPASSASSASCTAHHGETG